jgi:hypothetical protein
LLEARLGPRTLDLAKELVASVAWSGVAEDVLLVLVDDHLPYPRALLEVLGEICHRRRRSGRGRRKHAALKAPTMLWAGVVKKIRDDNGRLHGVQTRALFGRKKDVRRRIKKLGIGVEINTSHLERLNSTMRSHQARLIRRTRGISHGENSLQWSLWLWRDFYNWIERHTTLARTPAMAQGLTDHEWNVAEYMCYPVHVGAWQRLIWAEEREKLLTSPLCAEKR